MKNFNGLIFKSLNCRKSNRISTMQYYKIRIGSVSLSVSEASSLKPVDLR